MPIVISSPLQRWGKTARAPYSDLFPNAMGDTAGTCIRFPIKGVNQTTLGWPQAGAGTERYSACPIEIPPWICCYAVKGPI